MNGWMLLLLLLMQRRIEKGEGSGRKSSRRRRYRFLFPCFVSPSSCFSSSSYLCFVWARCGLKVSCLSIE